MLKALASVRSLVQPTRILFKLITMGDRDKNVYFAKLAEQAERYDEMAEYMEKVGGAGDELSVEERKQAHLRWHFAEEVNNLSTLVPVLGLLSLDSF